MLSLFIDAAVLKLAAARLLLTTVVLLCLASSFAGEAQTAPKVYHIGVMANTCIRLPADKPSRDAFFEGLREFGYVEGENFVLECRDSEGHTERFPQMAAELVAFKVDLIIVWTTPAALAAKAATSTIPILILAAHDPVGAGLAVTLARPGSNVYGLSPHSSLSSARSGSSCSKSSSRVRRMSHCCGMPGTPRTCSRSDRRSMRRTSWESCSSVKRFGRPKTSRAGFAAEIAQQRPDALLVLGDSLTLQFRHEIARFALQARLPSSFESKESAVAGGLMSYGPSYLDMWRRAGFYVDRLLKGVKPADLPIRAAQQVPIRDQHEDRSQLGADGCRSRCCSARMR